MSFPFITAEQAADLVQNGNNISFSGFTAASFIPIGQANMHKLHPRSKENYSMKGFYQGL